MTHLHLNQELREIYKPYLESLKKQTWDSFVSAPLLMHVYPEYTAVDRKILIVGQETHTWGSMNGSSVSDLLEKYEKFNLAKSVDYGDGKPFRNLKSPFWNFSRSLFHNLNKECIGVTRRTNGFLWTNISKFDYDGTTPDANLQDRNEAGFFLLKSEISILNPDVVVFLTGEKYNRWIDKVFAPLREEVLTNGYLQVLRVGDGSLPKLTFQTRHPRTLIGVRKKAIPNRYREVLTKMTEIVQSTIPTKETIS